MNYTNTANCVVVNYGDGASSQGAVNEALNFAAVYKAPVVFVCENNGWAISTPVHQQASKSIFAVRGAAFDIPSIRVDGNDIFAMIHATKQAVERAKTGEGPSLIEAVTYRMSLHTTADDPTVYRADSEVEKWSQRCPLLRFEIYLKNKNVLQQSDIDRIKEECDKEVLQARDNFYAMDSANPSKLFDHLYVDMPEELKNQRNDYLKRLKHKGLRDE